MITLDPRLAALAILLVPACAMDPADERSDAAEKNFNPVFEAGNLWAPYPGSPGSTDGRRVEQDFSTGYFVQHHISVHGSAPVIRLSLTTFGTFHPAIRISYWPRYENGSSAETYSSLREGRELNLVDPSTGRYEVTLVLAPQSFDSGPALELYVGSMTGRPATTARYLLETLDVDASDVEQQALYHGTLTGAALGSQDVSGLFDHDNETGISLDYHGTTDLTMTFDPFFVFTADLVTTPATGRAQLSYKTNERQVTRGPDRIPSLAEDVDEHGHFRRSRQQWRMNESVSSLSWTFGDDYDNDLWYEDADIRELTVIGIRSQTLIDKYHPLDLRTSSRPPVTGAPAGGQQE
jgi:hypothetical protein